MDLLNRILCRLSDDERSKLIQGVMRYDVFCQFQSFGYEAANKKLNELWDDKTLIEAIGDDQLGFNRLGVLRELDFWNSYAKKLSLIPTLDAGCAFDFVGRCSRHILRIDVTNNGEKKIEKGSIGNFGGPKSWKRLIADVDKDSVVFIDDKDDKSERKPLTPQSIFAYYGCYSEFTRDFFIARYLAFRWIEYNRIDDFTLFGLLPFRELTATNQIRLIAQLQFYRLYRQVLNLVPALSCCDFTDFIGESSGQLIRYHVLIERTGYVDKSYPAIQKVANTGLKVVVAVYDKEFRCFDFYDSDDYVGIEPNGDILKA